MLERLGIRARLVLASFVLTLLAGLAVERLTSTELEGAMVARVREELQTKLSLLEDAEAPALRDPGARNTPVLQVFAKRFSERGGVRVTLVAEDGRVVGDSGVDDAALEALENHGAREEIAEAREHGEGSAIRASPTLGTRMIYLARRASSPELGVAYLRVAVPLTSVDHAVAGARRAVALGTAAALALAALLFGFGAHRLTAPVRTLTHAALRMSKGELGARAPVRGRDELAMLGRALNGLAAQLSRTIEELRDERDVLSGILDGMSEGVLLLDPELRILLANRALRAIARLGDDATGKGVLEVIHSASLKEALDDAGARGAPWTREVELGGVLTRKLLVRVSRLAPSERGALLAVFHDVTDLRRLETIRTDFVANVSHELRTPVTAITTAAETLLGGALSDPADAREFVEVIDRNGRRLRHLVDDLLDLAKIEAKGFRLSMRDAEVGPIVEQTVRLLEAAARSRRVRVDVQVPKDLPRVHVDPRALEQVLSNLLDNAIKYGGEGARVVVAGRVAGSRVEISVSDDGPGIPKAHLERVFERFYRVDAGRSRELGGTGLGLSIVKHLTELMQGSVEVDRGLGARASSSSEAASSGNQAGEGASFRVIFPAAAGAVDHATPSVEREAHLA